MPEIGPGETKREREIASLTRKIFIELPGRSLNHRRVSGL